MELDSKIKLIPYIQKQKNQKNSLFQTYCSQYQTFVRYTEEENFCIYHR